MFYPSGMASSDPALQESGVQVRVFLGVLAIVLVRIAHPPLAPVPATVHNAADLTPEQRIRAGAMRAPDGGLR